MVLFALQVSTLLEMKQMEASEDALTEYGVANSTPEPLQGVYSIPYPVFFKA